MKVITYEEWAADTETRDKEIEELTKKWRIKLQEEWEISVRVWPDGTLSISRHKKDITDRKGEQTMFFTKQNVKALRDFLNSDDFWISIPDG